MFTSTNKAAMLYLWELAIGKTFSPHEMAAVAATMNGAGPHKPPPLDICTLKVGVFLTS